MYLGQYKIGGGGGGTGRGGEEGIEIVYDLKPF